MTTTSPRHVLHVCTTCCPPGAAPDAPRHGAKLLAAIRVALAARPEVHDVALNGVECMSGCNRPCTIALSAPHKPSYLFGDLIADGLTASQALELAALYCASETGVLVRAERPTLFRSGILARIPARPND